MRTTSITHLAVLALASLSHAFTVETFAGPNCEGEVLEEVNVYDNTCATWPKPFRSFGPKYFGGYGQIATIYPENACRIRELNQEFGADGNDEDFQKFLCIDLGFEGHALGSRWVL